MSDLEAIRQEVADAHGITVAELIGHCRIKYLVTARTEAIKRMRIEGATLTEIGRAMGGRDHTTILHHCRKSLADVENLG